MLMACVLGLVVAAGGCASGDARTTDAERPPVREPGSGFFVGTGAGGIGATLDLEGQDRVTAAVDAALRARGGEPGTGPVVGVASVVNEGPVAVPAPSFIADFAGGGALPMPPAARVVGQVGGPAARRAAALLARPPTSVPAGGAATIYVVLPGVAPGDVASVRMVIGPGRVVTMEARRR